MALRNLAAEMARYQVRNTDIQSLLSCSEKTVTNKIAENSFFSINEAFAIRDKFFPGMQLEYLFAREGEQTGERAG